jgi:hypothetical protein
MQMTWQKPTYFGIVQLDDDIWMVNAQIEKTLLDNRLSLSLSCNDIFNTMNMSGTMKIGNINQTVKQHMNQRQVMLTARYNFGSQQIRGARNRSVGIEEEMGRAR